MYVARFKKEKLFINTLIIKKEWSDKILSNEVNVLKTKRFLFHFNAKRWAKKTILKMLVENKELEFING